MKKFKNYIIEKANDIDPFEEEDWNEVDNQIFYDDETGLELEYDPK